MQIPWSVLTNPATGYALAVILAVGGVAAYTHAQRQIGRDEVLLAQKKATGDSLRQVEQERHAQVRRDSLVIDSLGLEVAALRAAAASRDAALERQGQALAAARAHLDSVLPAVTAGLETPLNPELPAAVVAYERQADSAVAACHEDVAAHVALESKCQERVDSLKSEVGHAKQEAAAADGRAASAEGQVAILERERPGALKPWVDRAEGAGVLYLLLRLLARLR